MSSEQLCLEQVIKELAAQPRDKRLALGWMSAHSDRGWYEQLAFAPRPGTTVGEMLDAALAAENKTFTGYKGGEFKMTNSTPVTFGEWGECGAELTSDLLRALLSAEIPPLSAVLKEAVRELEAANAALEAHDTWHQHYDEYGGYEDSDLSDKTDTARRGTSNMAARLKELVNGGC